MIVPELIEALEKYAARKGWPEIELSIVASGDGYATYELMQPDCAGENEAPEHEAGEVVGFAEDLAEFLGAAS